MTTFVVRRLLIAVPVFLVITIVVFVFLSIAPGDPASSLIPPELGHDPAAVAGITARYGLDRPIHIRYARWFTSFIQGDIGYRLRGGQPIGSEVARALRASVILMGSGLAVGMTVGVSLGILSAVRKYTKLDFFLTGITFLGISMPSFLLGLGGLWLIGLKWGLVPITGMQTVGVESSVADRLHHLVLPVSILAFIYAATFMRYTRSAMLEVMNQDYITNAIARGLPRRSIVLRHGFRNALTSVITIVGLSLPELIGGAVVLETVFSWPGIGTLLVTGVSQRDYFLVMGIAVVVAVTVLLANLMADIAYAYADPRVRPS